MYKVMTKKTRDWSKDNWVMFYKICHRQDEDKDFYIGSTTNMGVRKYAHKRRCNDEKIRGHNYPVYKYIRENGGWDCFKIQVLEEGIYNDRSLCNQREASLIREYEAKLNKCIPCA
jgi:hypothetical protein